MHPLSKFKGLKAEGGALDAINYAPTAVSGPGDGGKKRKKTQADKNNKSWQKSNKKKIDRSCRNNYIGN